MTLQPATSLMAHVAAPSGLVVKIGEGSRLVFGRGADADLTIAVGRGLSRRAGVISVLPDGAWIANISRTHALYTEGEGYRIRLPRMEEEGEPPVAGSCAAGPRWSARARCWTRDSRCAVTVSGNGRGWDTPGALGTDDSRVRTAWIRPCFRCTWIR